MDTPTPGPLVDFLIENDQVTVSLTPDSRLLVTVPRWGSSVIDDLSELPAALTDRSRFTAPTRFAPPPPRGIVLRAAPDHDLYVVWGNVVDAPVLIGTREEMLDAGVPAARLLRADRWGTSAAYVSESDGSITREYGFADDVLVVREISADSCSGFLERTRLFDFLTLMLAGDESGAARLLAPFEDDIEDD